MVIDALLKIKIYLILIKRQRWQLSEMNFVAKLTLRVPIGVRFYAKVQDRSPKRFKLSTKVGSGSKKKSSKPENAKKKTSESENKIFSYGNFGGLKVQEEGKNERRRILLDKISTLDQLKILEAVRDASMKVIRSETLVQNLGKDNQVLPSPIQVLAIKQLSKKLLDPKIQHHAIAAETGSGKTMAYIIPMMDYLKRQEIESPELWETIKNKAIIRAVIMVPTHELIDQVYRTVEKFGQELNLHTSKWDSFTTYPNLLENIKNRIDVLVTTPSKLASMNNIRMISRPDKILAGVRFVVLDEADTLMDKSWLEDTHRAITLLPNTNHLVFCSATIPNEFNKTLDRLFPETISITTPRLHRFPRSLKVQVINSVINPFKGSKLKATAQVLYALANDGSEPGYEKRCIIFVNEKKDVPYVAETLSEKYGHSCVSMSGDDTVEERLQKIKDFVTPPKKLSVVNSVKTGKDKSEKLIKLPESNITISELEDAHKLKHDNSLKILVSTDLMARGLNFQGIRNLILYDVPQTSIDLVHRVGRTARMRQSGKVFIIADKKTSSWAKGLPKLIKNNVQIS